MKDDKPEQKKGMGGGFILFLLAMIMVFFVIQSLGKEKTGNVSFPQQLEHLVNLQLIHPDQSRKVADGDQLVTFSGKFRDGLLDESKERYQYLSLLDKEHQLKGDKERLEKELNSLQKNVINSAEWFLEITGIKIPQGGFPVISTRYDNLDRKNSINIQSVKDKNLLSLPELQKRYQSVQSSPNDASILALENDLSTLLKLYASPQLGIGSDVLKKRLKAIDTTFQSLYEKEKEGMKAEEKIGLMGSVLTELDKLSTDLATVKDNIRLIGLRSVRNYVERMTLLDEVIENLRKNSALLDKARTEVSSVIWFFNNKEVSTRVLEKEDPELYRNWFSQAKKEWKEFSNNKGLIFKSPGQERNLVLDKTFKSQDQAPNYMSYVFTLLPIVLVVVVLYFLFSRQMKGVGSSAMSFGKSPAKLLTKESNKVTFSDVAGAEEAKEELTEIVDFLKDPQKFTTLGARIPKGVLLVGPPGTGKTLVAKAVAGEADRPFFSISGSDFVEMFVGVGASRVRDLFEQAKKNAPCIIFMDEIDAVGRHRGAGIGGGHDEREQTLNQLLVEMDGFDTQEGVILMAATNRPDILDKALLRPGRFDRRVVLDLPDVKGRFEILKVHARKIKIDPSVDLMDIAKNTPGSSGADLENILNEAALLAARKGRSAVTSVEAIEASDKVRFGKERRSLEMDEEEKKTTAFHESGHTIVGLTVKHADPVDKVTIIPRGFALGATHFMPQKNRLSYWRKEVIDQLAILMGGRAAEEVFVHDLSSGAQQDINQATKLARSMICEWGMSDKLGTVAYDERSSSGQYLGMSGYHEKNYSEKTAMAIDEEVKKLIDAAHVRAKEIVEENREVVQLMSDMLMEFETLDKEDIQEILEGTWDEKKKRKRLMQAEKLQKKIPPPPPKKVRAKRKELPASGDIKEIPNT